MGCIWQVIAIVKMWGKHYWVSENENILGIFKLCGKKPVFNSLLIISENYLGNLVKKSLVRFLFGVYSKWSPKQSSSIHLTHFPGVDFDQRFHGSVCSGSWSCHVILAALVISIVSPNGSPYSHSGIRVMRQ